MNAAADSPLPASPRAMATPHPTHTIRLLLRREFWEHKGGFLWAPLGETRRPGLADLFVATMKGTYA